MDRSVDERGRAGARINSLPTHKVLMADGFARNSITNAARSRTQLPSSIEVDFRDGPGAGIRR